MAGSGFSRGFVAAMHAVVAASACGSVECAGVVGASSLRPFFDRACVARVDVVALGDSNQVFGGHGWDHGWTRALANRVGVYATGLLSAGENGGNGAGVGYTWQGFSTLSTGAFVYSGAPPALDVFLPGATPIPPLNYLYRPSGEAGAFLNLGMFIEAFSPIDVNAALRFHLAYGVFEGDGPGSFQLSCRLQQSPFTLLVNGPVQSTRGGSFVAAWTRLDLPAGARHAAINFRFTPWGTNLVGPFLACWMRTENVDRPAGASFHTLHARGGDSARDMAAGLLAAADAQLSLYFGAVRALQEAPRRVLVRINSGLNDRNEPEPSVGPGQFSPGSSAEAFADNLRAIMGRIREVWTLNDWAEEELFFLLSVSHPVSDPDDPSLRAYRGAAEALALTEPRTAATRFERLTSAGEMSASGWYQSGGADRNHLTLAGFNALAERELLAAMPLLCPGDADGNGVVDFGDITAALTEFGRCAPLPGMGDADGDRFVSFADVTAVLTHWGPCAAQR